MYSFGRFRHSVCYQARGGTVVYRSIDQSVPAGKEVRR